MDKKKITEKKKIVKGLIFTHKLNPAPSKGIQIFCDKKPVLNDGKYVSNGVIRSGFGAVQSTKKRFTKILKDNEGKTFKECFGILRSEYLAPLKLNPVFLGSIRYLLDYCEKVRKPQAKKGSSSNLKDIFTG